MLRSRFDRDPRVVAQEQGDGVEQPDLDLSTRAAGAGDLQPERGSVTRADDDDRRCRVERVETAVERTAEYVEAPRALSPMAPRAAQ